MEIKDIIDYVEKTPCNSNPNVLETMLEELSGGGGEALKSASVYYFRASEGYQGDIPEGAAKMNIFFEDGETWSELIASDENPIVGFLDTYEYGKLFSVYNAYVLAQYLYMWSTYNSYVYKGNNVGTSTMIAPTDTIEDGGVYYFADFPGEDCMVAGSMISTSGKKADIDVIDIKVGDEIASLDPNTLEMTTAIVNEVK